MADKAFIEQLASVVAPHAVKPDWLDYGEGMARSPLVARKIVPHRTKGPRFLFLAVACVFVCVRLFFRLGRAYFSWGNPNPMVPLNWRGLPRMY